MAASPPSSKPYLLDLQYRGFVEGSTYFDAKGREVCHYFGGVPYALPPVGPFRWKSPRELPPCYRYGHRANPGRFRGAAALCPQPVATKSQDLQDEDCLQCNIWIPTGDVPQNGWPVLFFIHGGFLQFGSPNTFDFRNLLSSDTAFRAIIVCPAYRLNVLGFMACKELQDESGTGAVGNYGFEDLKLALDWTYKNVNYFGGDAANISLSGFSAGAHAAFHLAAHHLLSALDSAPIPFRRIALFSNGPGTQPKRPGALDRQFRMLCGKLGISPFQSGPELLAELRSLSPAKLIEANLKMASLHEFRACTDDVFVRRSLFQSLDDGTLARKMQARGIDLLMGEVRDEHTSYATWRPPREDSFDSLRTRLCADYDSRAVDAALAIYCPGDALPSFAGQTCRNWQDAFGRIYADLQIHALQRGLHQQLQASGIGNQVHRYRIERRARAVDSIVPPQQGVTHGTDLCTVWFWGAPLAPLQGHEKDVATPWVESLAAFIKGQSHLDGPEWGSDVHQVRLLASDGTTRVAQDDIGLGVAVWNAIRSAQGASRQSL